MSGKIKLSAIVIMASLLAFMEILFGGNLTEASKSNNSTVNNNHFHNFKKVKESNKNKFLHDFRLTCKNYIKKNAFCNNVKVSFTANGVTDGETLYLLGSNNTVTEFKFNEKILSKDYSTIINHELTHAYIYFKVKNKNNYNNLALAAQRYFKDYRNENFSKVNSMEVETECVMVDNFHYGDDYGRKSFYLSLSKTVSNDGIQKSCHKANEILNKYSI